MLFHRQERKWLYEMLISRLFYDYGYVSMTFVEIKWYARIFVLWEGSKQMGVSLVMIISCFVLFFHRLESALIRNSLWWNNWGLAKGTTRVIYKKTKQIKGERFLARDKMYIELTNERGNQHFFNYIFLLEILCEVLLGTHSGKKKYGQPI